jgi:hypothetical protein
MKLRPFTPNQAEKNETTTNDVRLKKAGSHKPEHGNNEAKESIPENQADAEEDRIAMPFNYSSESNIILNTQKPTFIPNMPNDAYHATTDISSSNIKTALKSMGKYKAQLDGESVFKTTPAMELGTLVHALVLEPHTFKDQFAVSEKFDGRTKIGKAAKAAFMEANEGKIIVDVAQMEVAMAMARSVMDHPEVKAILNVDGITFEHSGFCVDSGSGLRVKYRPDIRTDHFIADLKTCADASKEEFARSISKFGYHTSSAHYLKCDHELFGTTHGQFIFICVENTFPYEVAVYTLKSNAIDHGYDLCAKALRMIKDAQETGDYPQLNDGLACEIDIPAWAYKD